MLLIYADERIIGPGPNGKKFYGNPLQLCHELPHQGEDMFCLAAAAGFHGHQRPQVRSGQRLITRRPRSPKRVSNWRLTS